MTFRTFEEIDAEATPGLFTRNVAQRSLFDPLAGLSAEERRIRAEEERAKGEELASRSVVAAAFRQDNTIASFLSRKDTGVDNFDDGKFDPVRYVEDHRLQGYEDAFVGVLNSRRADAIRSQIEMEKRDKETLQAAGWWGVLAQIGAGVFDAPTLIPGTVAVRGATGSYAVGKSVLMAGVAAGATQAGTEAFLHASQQTRTLEESVVNVTGAFVLGSLLGGGVAALLNKGEARGALKALDEIADIQSGKKPNAFATSRLDDVAPGDAGAAVNPDAFYVDPINVARTTDELAISGKAAGFVAEKTAFANPVLRGTQRFAGSARQTSAVLYDDTMFRNLNDAGETVGTSVEASARTKVTALQAAALEEAELAYKASGGFMGRMKRGDFYDEVGRALRRDDVGVNEFVTRAAKAYRRAIDEATNDVLRMKLLDVEDLEVTTAASYLSRVYNRDQLLMSEPQFLDVIGKHLSQKMQAAYAVDKAKLEPEIAKFRQRVEDLNLQGQARVDRIDLLKTRGEKLDADHAHLNDLVDDLSAARSKLRNPKLTDAEKVKLRGDIADVLKRGGAEMENYLAQRAELRARMQNLTAKNPDAKGARRERLLERMDRQQGLAERSIASFARRAKNLINKIDDNPSDVAKADELVKLVQDQIVETRELVARAEARANKIGAAYVDAMDPAQAFADTAAAKSRQGLSGDEAISAGTKAADDMTRRIEASKATIALLEKRGTRIAELTDRLGRRETAKEAAIELKAELADTLQQITGLQAKRGIERGEFVQRMKDRAAKLTPEQIAKDHGAQLAHYTKIAEDHELRFMNRWSKRINENVDDYPFEKAGRDAAAEVYAKLTGRAQQLDDVPSFVTKITAGPLKDRVFNVPDELLVQNGWLIDDAREVTNRFLRSVYGEVELTRRFGRADMRDQLAQVAKEYSELKIGASKATTIDELNGVLGREKFGKNADLQKSIAEAQSVLALDERSAIEDLTAGRDMIRGDYMAKENNSWKGTASRSLLNFNYIRQMGGVLLANLTEFYRPAMVHGLAPYMRALPDAMAQSVGWGSQGLQRSIREAKLAGLITERVTHSLLQSAGDVGDPFLSKMTPIERLLEKGSRAASRWNFVNAFTDAQHTIASTVSQHRILEAVLKTDTQDFLLPAGVKYAPGAAPKVDAGTRLLRMLGMDAGTQADIARYFAAHGEVIDGLRVANTEKWLAAARADGNMNEILRAENAVRIYRTVLNTDVNSIISRRGMGDVPLLAQTPFGKLWFQFAGYAFGAHQRVMIRGLQESHSRLVGGLVVMSSLGAFTGYLASLRGGREQHEKRMKEWQANPAKLIAEGIDRSGFFALAFDMSNRIERIGGSASYEYRANPLKAPIAAAGMALGAQDPSGIQTRSVRASDSSAAFGAIGGPTAGLIDTGIAAWRVIGDRATGKTPPKQDIQQAFAIVPYQSYYGIREMLQVLHGNSNFWKNQ